MNLVINELCKFKRDRSLAFLLVLALLPVATGVAGALIGEKSAAADLAFFINNQFAMFFPMAVFLLAGSAVCREWRDGTYLSWVTYGIARGRLLAAKAAVCAGLSALMALAVFAALALACLAVSSEGFGAAPVIAAFAPGFAVEALAIVVVSTVAGTLVGVLSRSQLVTSVSAVVYGFASCLFIGAEWSFVIPGSFAYRVATACLDPATYYGSAPMATVGGALATLAAAIAFSSVAAVVFVKGRKIEP